MKNQLIFLAIIFTFSLWIGYEFGQTHATEANLFMEHLRKEAGPEDPTFFSIFSNNARIAFEMAILGTFFGIFPIIVIISNGVVIGIVSSVVMARYGVGALFMGLVPHGIIEIPSFFIEGACGLYLGRGFYLFFFYGHLFGQSFFRVIKEMLRMVIPLLLFAAFIETFITPGLLRAFL